MFEYMAAGLPFICSNFPLWGEIADETNSGFCIDPSNVNQLIKTINNLLDNPNLLEQMGRNGRKAVEAKYSWQNESPKIIELYERL